MCEIRKNLIGKKIIDISATSSLDIDNGVHLESDAGYIFITLDTKEVIRIWNSEWCGLQLFLTMTEAKE